MTDRICGACGLPGAQWFHVRLAAPVHGLDTCQQNLKGEDVRGHCMVLLDTRED